MVEELAEEREPGVERRGQAHVGRQAGDEEDLAVIGGTEDAVQAGAGGELRARRLVAAATAAGLLAVWSTIRLLMVRGVESMTVPLVCA